MSHWVGRGGHMNTYWGGGTSQETVIPINRHFASLIFGIVSPLVCSARPPFPSLLPPPPDRYSYEISKPKLVCIYKTTYIMQIPIPSTQ